MGVTGAGIYGMERRINTYTWRKQHFLIRLGFGHAFFDGVWDSTGLFLF